MFLVIMGRRGRLCCVAVSLSRAVGAGREAKNQATLGQIHKSYFVMFCNTLHLAYCVALYYV